MKGTFVMKELKAFVKPLEEPQRKMNMKIEVKFFFFKYNILKRTGRESVEGNCEMH